MLQKKHWALAPAVIHLLVIFAIVGRAGARTGPCNRSQRHLQEGETVDGEGIRYPNGTIVRTLDVGHIQQECIITFNSYFNPFSEGSFEVLAPENNLQARADNCCAMCHSKDDCNAWQWCPEAEGCVIPTLPTASANQTTTAAPKIFPYRGCQLMSIVEFSPSYQNVSGIRVRGLDIPFVAGTPFGLNIPKAEGYEVELGADFGGRFNYDCAMTIRPGVCMIAGNSSVLTEACNADAKCMGFSYQPLGVGDNDGQLSNTPIGFLKSNADGRIITVNDTDLNPTSAVFIKISTLAKPLIGRAVEQESNKVRTTILVACLVVAAVVLVAAAVGFVYVKRYRRMVKASPLDASNSPNGPLGEEGLNGSGSSGSEHAKGQKDRSLPQQHQPLAAGLGSPDSSVDPPESNELISPFMLLDQSAIQAMMAAAPHVVHVLPEDRRRADVSQSSSIPTLHQGLSSGSHGEDSSSSPEGSSSPGGSGLPGGDMHSPPLATSSAAMLSHGPAAALMALPQQSNSNTSNNSRNSTARELMDALSRAYRSPANIDYVQLTQDLETMGDGDGEEEGSGALRLSGNSGRGRKGDSVESGSPATAANFEDWAIKLEQVEICKRLDGSWWLLGTGACGTVYKGILNKQLSVAVKALHLPQDARHAANFTREIVLLKSLNHRHVVKFLGACLDGHSAMLVTELMELGDLWRALPLESKDGGRIFCWHSRGHKVMLDVAKGLQYLHSRRIVHLDLKSANILLNKKGVAKIADIGMAKVLNKTYLSILSGMGTFAWSAPELLTNKRCDEKVDIYSFGVVLWEVCTGQAPVRGDMRPLQASLECPQAVADLYLRCTQEVPELRPTAAEIVELLSQLPKPGQ